MSEKDEVRLFLGATIHARPAQPFMFNQLSDAEKDSTTLQLFKLIDAVGRLAGEQGNKYNSHRLENLLVNVLARMLAYTSCCGYDWDVYVSNQQIAKWFPEEPDEEDF